MVFVPAERSQIQDQIKNLQKEIELVEKFNSDFNTNLYEGIDIDEEAQKLRAQVGYFEEFTDVIKREQHRMESEVETMKNRMTSLNSLLAILESIEKQVGIVEKLQNQSKDE